jgi:hypothetical protein
MATFNLTAGRDIFPTDQDTAGNDLIIANAGDDVVFGGPGDDQIFGGAQLRHPLILKNANEINGLVFLLNH